MLGLAYSVCGAMFTRSGMRDLVRFSARVFWFHQVGPIVMLIDTLRNDLGTDWDGEGVKRPSRGWLAREVAKRYRASLISPGRGAVSNPLMNFVFILSITMETTSPRARLMT